MYLIEVSSGFVGDACHISSCFSFIFFSKGPFWIEQTNTRQANGEDLVDRDNDGSAYDYIGNCAPVLLPGGKFFHKKVSSSVAIEFL